MHKDTLLGRAGRDPDAAGPVNSPVTRASTILFENVAAFDAGRRTRHERDRVFYGTYGTQITFALAAAMAALEGGERAIVVSSGLAALVATLQTFLGSGDHVLVPDSVYGPVRIACDGVLRGLGIETTYYDPRAGAGIEGQLRPNTRLIYLESPGSITFEMQDVPAIVAVAKQHGIPTAIDNTWATGYFFNALSLGVDVSINAITKYVGGHSDVVLGAIVSNEPHFLRLSKTAAALGYSAAPDDCWLALRGLRTLGVRLRAHETRTQAVAAYLAERAEIDEVLYPALPGRADYAIWKRDFTGASGLFSFVFKREISEERAIAFIERLRLFSIGASWGGFESLALLHRPAEMRTLPKPDWRARGSLVRLHIGLEDPADLLDDLRASLDRL